MVSMSLLILPSGLAETYISTRQAKTEVPLGVPSRLVPIVPNGVLVNVKPPPAVLPPTKPIQAEAEMEVVSRVRTEKAAMKAALILYLILGFIGFLLCEGLGGDRPSQMLYNTIGC